MTFFCAKCQERHDVRDISADMWSICRNGLYEEFKKRFMKLIDEPGDHRDIQDDLSDLCDNIQRFINTPEPAIRPVSGKENEARINAFFGLNPNNLKQLTNVSKSGNVVQGVYTIRLSILLNLYARWESASYSIDPVPKIWFDEVMFEQPVKVYFAENGVLDKVTDLDNVPFSQGDTPKNTTMLGFTHICPHCGRVLSRASGTAEEIVVALAGAPRAGKTACLVSMLHTLLNGNCPGIRVIPMAHDDKWDGISTEITKYSKGIKVDKTPENITAVPSHSFKLQLNDKYRTQRVLTIVDMPGEFWQGTSGLTSDFFKKYSGIYENIDSIWFMISKATVCLSQVAVIPEQVEADVKENISEHMEIIRGSAPQNLSANLSMLKSQLQKPMPPIMVIVSKPDYSIGQLDAENTRKYKLFPPADMDVSGCNAEDLSKVLHSDNQRLYGLNQKTIWEHAANVRAFIEETCPSFLSAIEDNCPDRFYAAVSPYGHPAANPEDFYATAPTPYHELYPFLWTMAIHGGLQIHQDCKWIKKNFLGSISSTEHTRELCFYRSAYRTLPVSGSKAEKRKAEERNLTFATISNNLLMNGRKYVPEVVINHERT